MAEHDHGHTPAAWTGVTISFIGFCVAGGFMVASMPVGFWAGIGLTLLGAVVGGVMSMLGLGKKSEPVLRTPDVRSTQEGQEASRVHVNA